MRAMVAAMDTYEKLDYPKEKIKFVLNAPFPHSSRTKEKIELGLGISALTTIPYVQDVFVEVTNLGQPLVSKRPNEPIPGLLEDFAFHLSKDSHRKNKPENPSDTWKRVYKRFQSRKK